MGTTIEIEADTTEGLYIVEGEVTYEQDGVPVVKITSVLRTDGQNTVWFDKEDTMFLLGMYGATWRQLLSEKAEDNAVSGAEQRYEMALEAR